MAQDPEITLGGRYSLIERIGAGGMASVYLAEDEVLGREVAVKRLHADSAEDAVNRFRREAQLAAGLSHPNLVTVFDAFSEGDELVVVMEFVPGSDLSKVLRDGSLERERGLGILADLAAAVDHIHEAGIVHRDVKPANVLLSGDGEVAKLTDLGIARVMEETSTTQIDAIPGSLPYMSPEQLNGGSIGPPADIYSFSLVAYEVLSGVRVRQGTAAQISHQTTQEPAPDLREVLPSAPPGVAEVLRRGMAPDPGERPASAREIAEDLQRTFQAHRSPPTPAQPTPAPPPAPAPTATAPVPLKREGPPRGDRPTGAGAQPAAPAPRRSGARKWVAVAALALALAVAGVLLLTGDGSDDPDPDTVAEAPAQTEGGASTDGGDGEQTAEAKAESPTGSTSKSPAASVQKFYEKAAAGDFGAAIEIASPNVLALLGGPEGLEGTFSTLEDITFEDIQVQSQTETDAVVAFSTTAVHTNRTEACTGTASLVLTDETWIVDDLNVAPCDVIG